MAPNFRSISRKFAERSKHRLLLSRKELGVLSESYIDEDDHRWARLRLFLFNVLEMGRADPLQFIFAAKCGLALAIVSLLIFFKEPFDFMSNYAIYSILTVIHISEFSIGASLSKGFSGALGTLSAGILALGIHQISVGAGKWQEIVIAISVFIAGSISCFLKLYPSMKLHDFGFRVFMLSFTIVLESGTSDFAQETISRSLLIAVGACVCFSVTICVYPIWAGEDLHKLVVKNFRGVASSLEGCVNNYLQQFGYERIPSKILIYQASDDPLYSGYRSAVESASEEDALMGFAVWEPPHGHYKMLNYPWSNYVKVSGALRHCAFMVMAMHGCILAEIQSPAELRHMFKNKIQNVGTEGAKILRELGNKVEKLEKLSPDIDLLEKVHEAAEELQMMIDQKSYHLVNAEKWAAGKRPKDFEDVDRLQELKEEEIDIEPNGIGSLYEANIKPPLPCKTLEGHITTLSNQPSMVHWGSSEDMLKQQTQWPSRLSFVGETILNMRENLVSAFEELSETAKFSEPVNILEAKEAMEISRREINALCVSADKV
ncbi:putative aluminum-activated malate transporter [Helianthus annuus]|nr:putative aluminum-activated malate transporter [Helianthus annuus]